MNKGHNTSAGLVQPGTVVRTFTLIFLAAAAGLLLGDDFPVFVRFYAVILAVGLAAYPFVSKLFSGFADGGWLFAKIIGLALSGWLTWLFASVRILRFSYLSCIISVVLVAAAGILMRFLPNRKQQRKEDGEGEKIRRKAVSVWTSELIFLAFFLMWTYFRGFKPEASGTEKFMDYGFMAAILRSDYMPASDLWYAGGELNYYYVGQFFAAWLTRLSGATIGEGYNLMMALLGGMGFALPYSLSHTIMSTVLAERNGKKEKRVLPYLPAISGVLSGAAVSLCGNMHYPIYKWVVPQLRALLGLETDGYWFPDATRYIGYNPETNDKTIHEFPLYSYVLSDLHAHVLNTIFVLALLGVLFAWLLYRKKRIEAEQLLSGRPAFGGESSKRSIEWRSLRSEVLHPCVILAGFFIGLFHMTNYWDFPIYFVVTGAVILFSNAVLTGFSKLTILLTALHAAVVVAVGELTALPFTLCFDPISTEIGIAQNHTPFYQLMVLWGLPIFAIAGYLIILIRRERELACGHVVAGTKLHAGTRVSFKAKAASGRKEADRAKAVSAEKCPALFRFIGNLPTADLFLLTLGLCAIGLVLIPEIVYVKDIYTGDYLRANTMFKLTYQAFILFGICMGALITKYFFLSETKKQRIYAGVIFVLLLGTAGYFGEAVGAWYGDVKDSSGYQTLEASCYLKERMSDDKAIIDWLNENVEGTQVVLEAEGDSYTDYGRISVNTGLPTVLGWYVHEWLWRGDPADLNVRKADIVTIYTSEEEAAVRELIEQYDISYIVIGQLEIDRYGAVNHELLQSLGEVVCAQGATYLIRITAVHAAE
ncbi:MAG: hypothetical protein J6B85_10770 [Lachnospiraceae bacterium]|nr:hypothetical protein [Lachnospiraceae bacterium]